jgi:hypothetical protein
MRIDEVARLLEAEIMSCDMSSLSEEVDSAFAADLLSDVLAYGRPGFLLLTGLMGGQLIRTAEIAGIGAVIFVRSKRPSSDMIELASRAGMPLMTTRMTMYEACGRLYVAGVASADCSSVRGA